MSKLEDRRELRDGLIAAMRDPAVKYSDPEIGRLLRKLEDDATSDAEKAYHRKVGWVVVGLFVLLVIAL